MTNSDSTKCNVQFNAEWRSDGGFRIYVTNPTGLYVSSISSYAAAEYFQNFVPYLAAVALKGSGGMEMLTEFDWQEIASKGGGTCNFVAVSKEEVEEEFGPSTNDISGDFPPQAGKESDIATLGLHVVRREIGTKTIVVIQDFGDSDPLLEEAIRRQETAQ